MTLKFQDFSGDPVFHIEPPGVCLEGILRMGGISFYKIQEPTWGAKYIYFMEQV